jgi:hypothetical protein
MTVLCYITTDEGRGKTLTQCASQDILIDGGNYLVNLQGFNDIYASIS